MGEQVDTERSRLRWLVGGAAAATVLLVGSFTVDAAPATPRALLLPQLPDAEPESSGQDAPVSEQASTSTTGTLPDQSTGDEVTDAPVDSEEPTGSADDTVAVDDGGPAPLPGETAGLVAGWEAVACTSGDDGAVFTYRLFISDGRIIERERVDGPGSYAVEVDEEWGPLPSPIFWTVSDDGQTCQFA